MTKQFKSTPHTAVISSPIGKLGIIVKDNHLVALHFLPSNIAKKSSNDSVVKSIIDELSAYFENPNHHFSLKFYLDGTAFQKRVWVSTSQIKSGKTLTYGSLAKKIRTGARPVGQALKRNPIPIVIPCHRVIGAADLGGYSGEREGAMKKIKIWLLKHEGFC